MIGVKQYLTDLVREVSFRVLGFLGVVSTIMTFFPQFQRAWLLRWAGIICILLAVVVAHYRIYRRNAGIQNSGSLRELLAELTFNAGRLTNIVASTASELRTEAWQATSGTLTLPEGLRSVLGEIYMKIRSAKDLKQSIDRCPPGTHVNPEALRLEGMLDEVRSLLDGALPAVRNGKG